MIFRAWNMILCQHTILPNQWLAVMQVLSNDSSLPCSHYQQCPPVHPLILTRGRPTPWHIKPFKWICTENGIHKGLPAICEVGANCVPCKVWPFLSCASSFFFLKTKTNKMYSLHFICIWKISSALMMDNSEYLYFQNLDSKGLTWIFLPNSSPPEQFFKC